MFSDSSEKSKSLFDSFQTIDEENIDLEDEPKKKRGLFRRKK